MPALEVRIHVAQFVSIRARLISRAMPRVLIRRKGLSKFQSAPG